MCCLVILELGCVLLAFPGCLCEYFAVWMKIFVLADFLLLKPMDTRRNELDGRVESLVQNLLEYKTDT